MKLRLAVLLLIVAAAVGLFLSGAHEHLAPERLHEILLELGPWGPVLFVAIFALLEPLGFPSFVFLLAAPVVWPAPLAFALCLTGATLAGVLAWIVAHYLARDWVQARMPAGARAWDERLAEHGFRTVFVIRLLFFLAPWAHWVVALSSVRLVPSVIGSALGLAPGILLFVLLGESAVRWLRDVPPVVWAALALCVAGLVVLRRRSARFA